MPPEKPYWFPAKRYGWGWGPPATWQGWVTAVIWMVTVFAGLYLLRHNPYQPACSLAFVLVMGGILTLTLLLEG